MRLGLVALLGFAFGAGCSVSVGPATPSPSESTDAGSEDASMLALDAGIADVAVEGGEAAPVDAAGVLDAVKDVHEAGPFVPTTHPAWPQVPENQGVVLKSMTLVTVVSSGDALASQLFAFGDALVASKWWTTVGSEYGIGSAGQSVHVTGPAITQNPDQTMMVGYIQQAIQGVSSAAPSGHTMYMLYLPPSVVAIDPQNGTNSNCQYFGGYHDAFGTGGDAWGVGQRCPLQGTGLTEIQDLTITGSHEIFEGATDPQTGSGWGLGAGNQQQPWTQAPWLVSTGGELGDLCLGTQWVEGGYMYQRVWSNAAAMGQGDPCIPAYPNDAYFNSSAPQGWYMVGAGASIDVPMTGFSTKATADWVLESAVLNAPTAGFNATIASATTRSLGGMTFPTTNNGRSATLTVTAPNAPSGSWAVFGVASVPVGVSNDAYHLWPVGVYVP